MRIARTAAAAALTLGLASGLAPAQAAPAPVVAQVAAAPVKAAAAPANTKLTVNQPAAAKVGKTVQFKGKLTYKTSKGYKPLAKQEVRLLFPIPWEYNTAVLGKAKTSDKGEYTIRLKAEDWMEGSPMKVHVGYDGDSKYKASRSKTVNLKVSKK